MPMLNKNDCDDFQRSQRPATEVVNVCPDINKNNLTIIDAVFPKDRQE
jgi:hypothetical protein